MEREPEKKPYDDLGYEEQKVYLQRAQYLIQYGYVEGKNEDELAKEIYSKRRM